MNYSIYLRRKDVDLITKKRTYFVDFVDLAISADY